MSEQFDLGKKPSPGRRGPRGSKPAGKNAGKQSNQRNQPGGGRKQAQEKQLFIQLNDEIQKLQGNRDAEREKLQLKKEQEEIEAARVEAERIAEINEKNIELSQSLMKFRVYAKKSYVQSIETRKLIFDMDKFAINFALLCGFLIIFSCYLSFPSYDYTCQNHMEYFHENVAFTYPIRHYISIEQNIIEYDIKSFELNNLRKIIYNDGVNLQEYIKSQTIGYVTHADVNNTWTGDKLIYEKCESKAVRQMFWMNEGKKIELPEKCADKQFDHQIEECLRRAPYFLFDVSYGFEDTLVEECNTKTFYYPEFPTEREFYSIFEDEGEFYFFADDADEEFMNVLVRYVSLYKVADEMPVPPNVINLVLEQSPEMVDYTEFKTTHKLIPRHKIVETCEKSETHKYSSFKRWCEKVGFSPFFYLSIYFDQSSKTAVNGALNIFIALLVLLILRNSNHIITQNHIKKHRPSYKIVRRSQHQDHVDLRGDNYKIGKFRHSPNYAIVRERLYKPQYRENYISTIARLFKAAVHLLFFGKFDEKTYYEYDRSSGKVGNKLSGSYGTNRDDYKIRKGGVFRKLVREEREFEISLSAFFNVCTPNKLSFDTPREVRKEMVSRAFNRLSTVNVDDTRHFLNYNDEGIKMYRQSVMSMTQHFTMAYIDHVVGNECSRGMQDFY